MNTVTKLAASASLVLATNLSAAALLDVTATLSAEITGLGSGSQSGTAVGTYDTETQILTLASTYEVVNTGTFSGSMDQTGETIIDFGSLSGSNEVLTCEKTGGTFNLCSFVPSGPQTLSSVSGDWESFVAVSQYSGATTTQTWTVVGSPVPVPAAAWLFATALIGLSGIARRRTAA